MTTVTAFAGSGPEAVARLDEQRAEIAFLDLRLGRESGIDLLPQLLQQAPDLSVVAPCFNEGDNVQELVDRLNAMFARRGLRGEVVLVDDASTDATPTVLRQLAQSVSNLVVCTHPVNGGIEAAWRTGLKAARGTYEPSRCCAHAEGRP